MFLTVTIKLEAEGFVSLLRAVIELVFTGAFEEVLSPSKVLLGFVKHSIIFLTQILQSPLRFLCQFFPFHFFLFVLKR